MPLKHTSNIEFDLSDSRDKELYDACVKLIEESKATPLQAKFQDFLSDKVPEVFKSAKFTDQDRTNMNSLRAEESSPYRAVKEPLTKVELMSEFNLTQHQVNRWVSGSLGVNNAPIPVGKRGKAFTYRYSADLEIRLANAMKWENAFRAK